jgi:hypothetical protein
VIIHRGYYDPFSRPVASHKPSLTKALRYITPPRTLNFFLTEDPFCTGPQALIYFVSETLTNLRLLRFVNDSEIDLLFANYETIVSNSRQPVNSLLAVEVKDWALDRYTYLEDIDIARFSKFTKDLHRLDSHSRTILDHLLCFNFGSEKTKYTIMELWLHALVDNGVDVRAYCQREISLHSAFCHHCETPNAYHVSCRIFQITFDLAMGGRIPSFKIDTLVQSGYLDLDPTFLCEELMGRRRCLSQVDRSLLKDGKPFPAIPGIVHLINLQNAGQVLRSLENQDTKFDSVLALTFRSSEFLGKYISEHGGLNTILEFHETIRERTSNCSRLLQNRKERPTTPHSFPFTYSSPPERYKYHKEIV